MAGQIRDQLQATLGAAYTLERELGGGGMSRVFVAEETALRRKVVVKVLPPELTAGVNVERFNREILLAAKLQHPHIVPVLAAGETQGLPYYTMPLVEGESLRARLMKGPLGITEATSILKDVARALAYAHERGIVHRDIKPDNVLITGGSATVTDFGIAKAISASRTQGSGNETLTQVGTSIGTPTYMSPEQASGDPTTDHRADIYSFGCMAYELLAGRPPFVDTQPRKLLAAHMGEKPAPVTDFRPDTPPALADLIMRCLAKEADDRPQNATDLVRVIETVTSSGSGQALPSVLLGGAGMFKKALAIYAAAFVVVAVVAKAAIVGIGLPDWVFPGSLIVMALGLPVVLWTGYVQRVARKAATATPAFTPGGTPSMAGGTIATMALKAAPHVSWYKTARGGMYAFGAFIVMIAAFMLMRAFGIGPFGSLIATGDLAKNNRIVIADFTAANGDSALGRVVSDAVRAGLSDSRIFSILTPSEVAAAVGRMQQNAKAMLTLDIARQVAMREGVKAVVDGSVTPVGSSYIVQVRLVTSDSARELVSYRATASNSDAIIPIADELSRKLRAKAGESLRSVAGSAPLAYATTGSLDALRKYSEGARANDIELDRDKAIRLLREAVQLDSNFAEAWRKLAVAMGNRGTFAASAIDSVLGRAVALTPRLNDRDRDLVLAYYYEQSPTHGDRAKAVDAYRRMLARGDSQVATNNLAGRLRDRGEYAAAESLYRARVASGNATALHYSNMGFTLELQGKWAAEDSIYAAGAAKFPGSTAFTFDEIGQALAMGKRDRARTRLDSVIRAGRGTPGVTLRFAAGIAYGDGRFAEAWSFMMRSRAADSASGGVQPFVTTVAQDVGARGFLGAPTDAAVRRLDSVVAAAKIESLPVTDRPYGSIVSAYAMSGHLDKAHEFMRRFEASLTDTAVRRIRRPAVQSSQAAIAAVEKRWAEAADLYRKSNTLPDGPVDPNPANAASNLIWVWAQAGHADSVIAEYERYLKTPYGGRTRQGPDFDLPAQVHEGIAKAYDAKGNVAKAVEQYRDFIEIWKNADPELQPRVAAARKRLTELTPVEGKRK